MLKVYMDSALGDCSVKKRLRRLLDRGHEIAGKGDEETAVTRCCINTELNSTNFLVDDSGFVRLVDWEKPLYGDPAQDLGHLLAPTTTFWKTDTVLSAGDTYEAGSTGGEATHTLTIDEIPSHTHQVKISADTGWNSIGKSGGTESTNGASYPTGGGQAHNNMPPYLAVYMWKRTA